MAMSRRTLLVLRATIALGHAALAAKAARDSLRDNYASLLSSAEEEYAARRDEVSDSLLRLNALRTADGLPELTLQDLRDF